MPTSAESSSLRPSITPVILCGGAGTRLWPASTPDRPKPFTALVGDRSGFQDALTRAMAIAEGGRSLVVGATANRALIEAEARASGASVDLLLEPEGRGSAAALAAAAVRVAETDRESIMVVLSADHHVDDLPGFVATVEAAAKAAAGGAIVTLGVRPTAPLTGFGYLRPGEPRGEANAVVAFVEKPDPETAARFIQDGHLWNSGIFIAAASTLLSEFERFAPEILGCARSAVSEGGRDARVLSLGPAFLEAPNTSLDYAVMEKTALAQVVPARFGWADIGAWDAVWAASDKDERGNAAPTGAVLLDSDNNLALAHRGVRLGLIGVRDLAVVATPEAVLVCPMERSQDVKTVAERMAANPRRVFADLAEASVWFDRWMRTSALPLWWAIGADHAGGGFAERLDLEGRPTAEPRRLRVQARQVFVYASAGLAGWTGPWREAVDHGLDGIMRHYRRDDGLYATHFDPADGARSDEASTYDQAFVLLALAASRASGLHGEEATAAAERLAEALQPRRTGPGGYREIGADAFQADANMHLFEALLAWARLDPGRWGEAADELGAVALSRFFDQDRGVLHEHFDADWRPRVGQSGRVIAPGHQFEWASLFRTWAELRDAHGAVAAAEALIRAGERGVDPARGVAVDLLRDDFSILEGDARLWPQTERLRAAHRVGDADHALEALHAIRVYIETPVAGLWRDKLSVRGAFVQEPAPASTLYHLLRVWLTLRGD